MSTPPPAPSAQRKRKPKHLTWEHPKGSGIKISRIPNKTGGTAFGNSYQIRIPAKLLGRVDRREVLQRPTEAEAKRLAEDRFMALQKHGTEFSKMPATAQKQAAIAWGMLNVHGLDFIQAAEAAIRHLRPEGGQRTLTQVINELEESKRLRFERGELDWRTHEDFKLRGVRIGEALGAKLINTITAKDISDWLEQLRSRGYEGNKRPLSQRSVLNYRNIVAEIFRHAVAKRYCAENPLDYFTREDYKALGGVKAERELDGINILSVVEVRKLLEDASKDSAPGLLASLVLRLFCGLRTAETCRLDWSEVRWLDPKPYVHIPAGKAKKRRIRQVQIPENALAWLKRCDPPASGWVVSSVRNERMYCNQVSRLAKAAGIKWENNDTRHSFGSYHFALHGDSIRTAKEMGHKQGDDTLFAHYRTLVSKEDAEAYFNLRPGEGEAKVTQFPAAARA
jgi:integrase